MTSRLRAAPPFGIIGYGSTEARRVADDANRVLDRVATAGEAACFIGRCVNYENSATQRAALWRLLRDGDVDWLLVADLANRAHLIPALDMGLQRKALDDLLPADFRRYLAMIRELNRQRNRRIAEQSDEVFQALNGQGLRPVLMKGGLSLFEVDLDEGLLMMADMDILLAEEEIPLACRALRTLGYVMLGKPPSHAHAFTFHRPGELATIDLHRHVGPQLRLLSVEDALRSAMPLAGSRHEIAGLCPTHRVLLLFLNYCLFEPQYRSRELPLKGLHDLAAISRRHCRKIDWTAVANTARRHSLDAAVGAWFTMARHLLEVPVPPSLFGRRSDRRHLRRCLAQLDHPGRVRPIPYVARFSWLFGALRIDYRYRCGLRGTPLAASRLRHAFGVLTRRGRAGVASSGRAWFRP